MSVLTVHFNPWSETFKKPFGAVATNHSVEFSIEVLAKNPKVSLVIQKENSYHEEITMTSLGNSFYHTQFFLDSEIGLYYYYFKIKMHLNNHEMVAFVGKNFHGTEALITGNYEELQQFQLTAFEPVDQTPQWYQQAIAYQIFPDRFNEERQLPLPKRKNSFYYLDKSDSPYYIKDPNGEVVRWDFYGGNFAGILAKLPYLKKLGITLLYLNPIFEAGSNHRYDTADYFKVDDFLGTNQEFKAFTETLHEAGIRVILDGVFNHVGRNSRYFNGDSSYEDIGAYQSQESPYYPWFNFNHYPDDYRSWWGFNNLPETNKNNHAFQNFIYGKDGVIDFWSQHGVDGWRIDVADELPDFFLRGIRERLNQETDKVLIGEVWEDASNKIAYNQRRNYLLGNSLHGVMNYPLKNGIVGLITNNTTPEKVAFDFTTLRENYPKANFFNGLNHLSTHDTERIFSLLHENEKCLELAVALLFCSPGIPCVYYGDEVGLTGGKDPDNRKFFPWGQENTSVSDIYQKWSQKRQKETVLTDGEVYFGYEQDFFIMIRSNQTNAALLTINIGNTAAELSLQNAIFPRSLPEKLGQIIEKNDLLSIDSKSFHYQSFSI